MEDDPKRFITGRAGYVDDLHLDKMLHLKMVRSPYARAKILKVKGGINGSEFTANLAAVGEGAWGQRTQAVPYPVLASDYVSYVGQPVAAVLAEDPYKAEDMIEEVEVEYDALKPLVNHRDASSFEPIHPNSKSNIAGSVELGENFDLDAPVVIEDELSNERISPNPMEPRGIVAHYDGSKLTVWASTQSVHTWKSGLSSVMTLPKEAIRVVQMDTGGAFGTKSGIYPEYAVACYATMKTRRPVKWVETRSENEVATSQGRGASAKMKLYAERSGRILGIKANILVDSGAFAVGMGGMAPWFIGFQITGPYVIEKCFVRGNSVLTNKVPLGPYRGAGRPEAAFFRERMIDLLADELKIDPVELRLKNVSSKPFTSPLGMQIDPYEPFLRSAIEDLGYHRSTDKEHLGFSAIVLMTATQPGESARIAVKDGKVTVWMGGSSGGQALEVIAKKLVSEELGVKGSLIHLEGGDTDQLDQGIGTWGSRTAEVGGAAIIEAARKVKEEAMKKLGEKYSQEELLRHEFDVTIFHEESEQANSFGVNMARASFDKETGIARAEECLAYYDAGRVLNEFMVESQVVGGTAQGVGQVLYEEAKYDNEGQLVTATISDAGLIDASLMPKVVLKLSPQSNSQQKIKGIAEAPTTGIPPALIRAVEKKIGKRLRDTPLHPEELLLLSR